MWELIIVGLFIVYGLPVLFLIIYLSFLVLGLFFKAGSWQSMAMVNWWFRQKLILRLFIVFFAWVFCYFSLIYSIFLGELENIGLAFLIMIIGLAVLPLMIRDEIKRKKK